MKKVILVALALCTSVTTIMAQSTGEALLFSRYNFGLSTARSAGMGGAFTSLGADAASLSINPAGMAMYSSSEIVVSPGLKIGSTRSTNYDFNNSIASNFNKAMTRATVNNFGAVYANGTWAIGVAYNRLADFNGISYTEGGYGTSSMVDIFVNQLQGTPTGTIGSDSPGFGFRHSPAMWPAILGYQTFIVNPDIEGDASNTGYNLTGVLDAGDQMASTLGTTTTGGIDEFAFSGAYNINSILYVGATIGVQSIYRTEASTYSEFAKFDPLGNPLNAGALNYFALGQVTALSGVGVNLKIGATVRPLPWLRIGVAYHSPTWITMRETTTMDMSTELATTDGGSADFYSYTPDLVQDYNMSTPSRLLTGISFTIANRVIISADYEYAWYNSMKYTTPINAGGWRAPVGPNYIDCIPNYSANMANNGDIDINSIIGQSYRPTSTVRLGVEARPIDKLFLRAGFGYSQSPYKDIEVKDYDPQRVNRNYKLSDFGDYMQFSGGLGYRNRKFNLDLTYVYGKTSSLPATFFDYKTIGGVDIRSDYVYRNKTENHNIILSFGWRF